MNKGNDSAEKWNDSTHSVPYAPNTKAIRLIVVVHVAVATVEVQVPTIGSIVLCTAPVVAVGTAIVQRTIAVVQVPCGINTKSYHSVCDTM